MARPTAAPVGSSGVQMECEAMPEAERARARRTATPQPVSARFAPAAAARVRQFVAELPPAQRQVVTLRDVEGLPSAEVCDILGISEGNQRVLLHRARARIRRHLEQEAVW